MDFLARAPALCVLLPRGWGTLRKMGQARAAAGARLSEVPLRPLVTTCAVGKIVAAEGPPVVVAGDATLRARGRMVHGGEGRAHLPPRGRAGPRAMAILAAQPLPAGVSGVTEIKTIGFRPNRSPREPSQPVAGVA